MMIEIHFLGNFNNYYNRHYHPIRAFKKQLFVNGIKTRFFPSTMIPGIENCDVLMFFSDGYRDILPLKDKSKQTCYQYLAYFFTKFDRVVWFDDHDSSGKLEPGIFPLVDVYAKAQILKDKSYYLKSHRVGALHRDYVYEQNEIDDRQHASTTITQDDLNKLRLGWNLSLINWNYYFADSKFKKVRCLISPGKYQINFINPKLSKRNQRVIFRGRMWENEPTVGWWREETVKHIKAFNEKRLFSTPDPKKTVSRKEYHDELSQSMICTSPFGKGEICYRDFEAFLTGSVLIKPDMSHITTWPNFYIEGETYFGHNWDFHNFYSNLDQIINSPEQYQESAAITQNRFIHQVMNETDFMEHLLAVIKSSV